MYQHTRNEFEHFRAPAEIEGDGDYVLKRERLVSRSSAAETSSIPGDYCCTWTNIAACQQQSHPGEAHMRISDPHRAGGVLFLLSGVRIIHVDTHWVWPILLIGIGIAFLLEWLYGERPSS